MTSHLPAVMVHFGRCAKSRVTCNRSSSQANAVTDALQAGSEHSSRYDEAPADLDLHGEPPKRRSVSLVIEAHAPENLAQGQVERRDLARLQIGGQLQLEGARCQISSASAFPLGRPRRL